VFDREKLISELKKMGVKPGRGCLEGLLEYGRALQEKSKKLNLVAPGDEPRLLERHLLDSLAPLPLLARWGGPWMDLGSGGGLPGIPLALCWEKRPGFLVESRAKKAYFLEKITSALELEDIHIISKRAEALGHDPQWREQMFLVMARGLAPLPSLLELAFPLLKTGGSLLAWKGPGLEEELSRSEKALELLGGEQQTPVSYQAEGREYFLLEVIKRESTPERFPRSPAAIKKRPL